MVLLRVFIRFPFWAARYAYPYTSHPSVLTRDIDYLEVIHRKPDPLMYQEVV